MDPCSPALPSLDAQDTCSQSEGPKRASGFGLRAAGLKGGARFAYHLHTLYECIRACIHLIRSDLILPSLSMNNVDCSVHVHAYTHKYMHACTHTRMHACIHSQLHTVLHYLYVRTHACTMHASIQTFLDACMHASIPTCVHACMHSSIHPSIHVYGEGRECEGG